MATSLMDNNQSFVRKMESPLQKQMQERKVTNFSDEISKMKVEIAQERDKKQRMLQKEKTEPTIVKKKKNPLFNALDLISNKINKKKNEQIEDSGLPDVETIKIDGMSLEDVLAPIDMEVDFNNVQIGKNYYRTLFVSGYPRFVGPNWLSSIINFEHSIKISTFYYPVDSKEILQKLKRKIGEMEATLFSQMEGRKVPDPAMKVALTDAQQLQDAIAEGVEKFFHFSMYVTISADSKEKLEKITQNAISTLSVGGVIAKIATLQQEQGFVTTQPLGLDKMYITRNMDTTSIATTFPFVSSELTMDHGVMYGMNLHNRSLVIFDRFDMENANSVIFAKSGAGKSYFVKLEAVRWLMLGAEVIIIDPEKEFEPLCQAVNGAYISFSQDKGHKMNPFELSGLGDENDDELRMKILSLQGFLKILLGQITPIDQAILDRALLLTYREKGITLDPKTQRGATPPLLEDLYKVLKGMSEPEARAMASRLERYIIGSAAGIFNEISNVKINNPFTVFSVRDLQEELRPMAMYLMLDYIWTKIRMDKKRRILIVDEAWYMMQHEDSSKFMYSIAKRARKYYLGVSTITQDVDDFLKNDMGRAIITNSAMQMLLKQSPTAIDRLQQVFNLSEGEKSFLLSCDKGQGIFFAGSNHVAIQVVSSQAEHELITTDPKDLERMAKEDKSIERSIEELSQLYEPPAMKTPINDGVQFSQKEKIEMGIEKRKEDIKQIMEEKLMYRARPIEEQQPYQTLTDQVVAERQNIQSGQAHMNTQGEVEFTKAGSKDGQSTI